MASMRTGLAEPGVSPVEAALRILDRELGGMTSWLATHDDPVQASAMIQRLAHPVPRHAEIPGRHPHRCTRQ